MLWCAVCYGVQMVCYGVSPFVSFRPPLRTANTRWYSDPILPVGLREIASALRSNYRNLDCVAVLLAYWNCGLKVVLACLASHGTILGTGGT